MPLQFPTSKNGWRLDVVGLLAIIGEASMNSHTQLLTASWMCLLPRLMPAPQALLKPHRPPGLSSKSATIVGVHSGVMLNELNYFANLLHPVSKLKYLTVQEISIKHKSPKPHLQTEIVPRLNSPLNILTIVSSLVTAGLLVWSVMIQDGVACLAICVISTVSSIVGLASLWQPHLIKRAQQARVPPGDVVVRTREGAFLVIHCPEEVARELYVGAERCNYLVDEQVSQTLVGFGTFLFMTAVVLMGNCSWEMQLALGIFYVVLNGAYWAAALFSARRHWNLDRYEVTVHSVQVQTNYTEALWKAIQAASRDELGKTRDGPYLVRWAKISDAAPQTAAWGNWLNEAEDHLRTSTAAAEGWDPVGRWQALQRDDDRERGEVELAPLTRPPAAFSIDQRAPSPPTADVATSAATAAPLP